MMMSQKNDAKVMAQNDRLSDSVSESTIRKNVSFNLPEIEAGVSKLVATKSVIKEALNPQVYDSVVETIDSTIRSLNEVDDLIPYQEQIQNQIIEPVSEKIKRSSAVALIVSILFGITGILSLYFSVIQAQNSDQLLSEALSVKDSTIEAQASQISSLKDETTAFIYPEDIILTINILRKFLSCKEIINSLTYVEKQKIVHSAQQELEDELSPFMRAKTLEFQEYSLQLSGVRKPPQVVVVHPYQLEATANILSTYFSLSEIQEALGDCK